jgi:methyl-accepting chemotaxis protein
MMKSGEAKKGKFLSWNTAGRVGFTAIFFFWIYMTWNSTADLDSKLNAATDQNTAIQNIQVDFKEEVQLWKDLLLRSTNPDTLSKNWAAYQAQYQKVAAEAQEILRASQTPSVNEQIRIFVDAHAANLEKYKGGMELLIKSQFDPHAADAMVMGIDRPLIGYLEVAETNMMDDKKRIDKGLVDTARNNIEQDMFALAFLALLAVWMPRY